MESTDVAVIGAGPAGLALSACLAAAAIEHVVLERHAVGWSWRRERWDSLCTLTPNWMNGLPQLPYRGPDPDGFMTAGAVADLLAAYAASIAVPVTSGTTVSRVAPAARGHRVETDGGAIHARAVVLATGPGVPSIPGFATAIPEVIQQLTARNYRNPAHVAGGRVLVVGGSASGVQLADELVRAGRDVTLAVGEHVRLPRTYRGRDSLWWMQVLGVSSRRWDDDLADIVRARHVPSPQLIGTAERRTLDLRSLQIDGVRLVGRLVGIDGRRFQLSGSLANLVANADLKQARFLDQVDELVTRTGIRAESPDRPPATEIPAPPTSVDVRSFDVVIWATGHRHAPPRLDTAHLDRQGRLVHDGGVLGGSGLFVIGLPFLRRRSSTFLSGIGRDAVELTTAIRRHLDTVATAA